MIAVPKPQRGALRAERTAKRAQVLLAERRAKAAVRRRDGALCRWPGCAHRRLIEVAHLTDKGMGGDGGRRTSTASMLCLCWWQHRGPRSLHSKDLRIEARTDRGADGPLRFLERSADGWVVVGVED